MILGILTIVLALAFSLLHLAAAFSAMKQKNYSLGNKCILVWQLPHLSGSSYLLLCPTGNHSSMDCRFDYRLLWCLLERRQQENQHISHHIIRITSAIVLLVLLIFCSNTKKRII